MLSKKLFVWLFAGAVVVYFLYGTMHDDSVGQSFGHQYASQVVSPALSEQSENTNNAKQAMLLAQQMDIELLMEDVRWLADDAREGRASGFPGEDAAAQWLVKRYQNLGLQPFKQAGFSGYMHTFTFPYDDEYVQGENIIGVLPGDRNADEFVVIAAHYDHLGIKEGEIYNGADDDASGVAALLEMARVFVDSGISPQKSIVFISFTGEEIGHIGSSNFCKQMIMRHATDKFTVLNLEMLGAVKETYINIWDQDNILTKPIIAAVAAASEQLEIPMIVSTGLDPGSDAVELLECDITATTMDTGGGEDFYDNHPHYHAATDDPEHIDQDVFLKAAQVATIAIWRLANNDFR